MENLSKELPQNTPHWLEASFGASRCNQVQLRGNSTAALSLAVEEHSDYDAPNHE